MDKSYQEGGPTPLPKLLNNSSHPSYYATHNNLKKVHQSSLPRYCLGCSCSIDLKPKNSIYCSSSCSTKHKKDVLATKWLSGEIVFGGSSIPKYIKEYLRDQQNGHCLDCGLDQWEGVTIPLQVEHKNGKPTDNTRENLCLVCPNCHALKPTSGSRNTAGGRPHRLKYEEKTNMAVKAVSCLKKIHKNKKKD